MAPAPTITLNTAASPTRFLKGVGPKRSRQLAALGITAVSDMLYYFPRDWHDRRKPTDLSVPAAGQVLIRAKVARCRLLRVSPRLGLLKATLATGERKIEAVWFKHLNPRFDVFKTLKREVCPGADLWVIGRCESNLLGVTEVRAEEHYPLDDPRGILHVGRIVPVYALTEGISARLMRELAHQAVAASADSAPEIIPPHLLAKRSLLSLPQALRGIHFPGSFEELAAARSRLAYEEFLLLELAWILKRRQTRDLAKGFTYEVRRNLLSPFRENLGFELTGAQKRVINEIFSDMQRPSPMTRLLQGDVGSGKTVVALSALLLAVENGAQGALMVPTEILADQHFTTLRRFLRGLSVKTAMLTSRLSKKEREAVLTRVRTGEVDLLVGTHALLEEDVQFPRLRLAVIDEQHRFGVRQRTSLRQKGSLLDLLVMTATPIPRTLALALYGDLDVSTLDEMPPGKTTARTVRASESAAIALVKAETAKGRQAYIVYPIISESSRLDVQAAKAEYERLKSGELKDLKVALIHGAMPGRVKARVMEEFAAGQWQALVATPVIEVGIDVPNATVMVIQNAQHFGMSSLHQLRGRIGRGALESTCVLVADPRTPEAQRRVETLVATADGFRIGEEDLKIRGPGELLGTAQHGELALRIADLSRDSGHLAEAREDAEALLAADGKLLAPVHAALRARVIELYQKKWNWIDLA